jgi:signal transduction histidine kinase/CheY-like chemotaxis protein
MIADTFPGGGEMAALMRSLHWAETPVGTPQHWPQSLRTAVSICLASRFPMSIYWGSDLVQFYNDAFRPILGVSKHPAALGQRARDCWAEIWEFVGPRLEGLLAGGEATWAEDQQLLIDRNGYVEECYFTFSYSAIPGEGGAVGGVFCAVTETTNRVLGDRRQSALHELAVRTAYARRAEDACIQAATALGNYPFTVPFALLYLLDDEGHRAQLAAAVGIDEGLAVSPLSVDLTVGEGSRGWPLAAALDSRQPLLVADVPDRFGSLPIQPPAPSPRIALILPIARAGEGSPAGLMVAGVNPQRALDDRYLDFFTLAANQVGTAVASARAHEEERRRAEALAELDRAKTAFFSNVSHEFRTPLTLMLGPLEDLLAEGTPTLTPADRDRLAITHRNALRLLKLVNTLLDFSRLEAGRTQAAYAATELHTLTSDLTAVFRTAIERVGLSLAVDCAPLPEPIYVDHDMWEKIVLNLLSNALKFTFEGRIEVTLRSTPGGAALTVADTGTGIAQEELSHLFERFHRVQGARAHTYEGTGIGLALVAELVKLHGGTVAVESRLGVGTSFTVCLPTGTAHLPADQVIANPPPPSSGLGVALYIEEALLWGQNAGETEEYEVGAAVPSVPAPSDPAPSGAGDLILVVDDNADMRDYLTRLLGRNYAIESATNGAAALAAARARIPDLVVSDVMMPELDGFGLLRALRADLNLREVPVILLSARAGVEATAEGLDAGADDYLVKPFTARELLARVRTHLALARSRREARDSIEAERDRLRQVLDALPEGVTIVDALGRVEALNRAGHDLLGLDTLGRTMPPAGDRAYLDYGLRRADGTPYPAEDLPLTRSLRQGEEVHGDQELIHHAVSGRDVPLLINSAPLRDSQGTIVGAVAAFQDITPIRDLEVAREEFIASAAHDLKTPLTSIHGLAELARLRLSRLNPDIGPIAEQLLQIEASTMKVVSLLDELLDVTQLHMGSSLNLNPRPTDLAALVHGVLADLENVTTHRLRLVETGSELTVTIDAARIERVVSNLLLNAVKYSPGGGTITVTIAREEGPSGPWAVVAVQDEGMGIPEDDLPFIFDRFRRGRNVTGHIQGTGIGLTGARRIVEQHGGTITAESTVGAGSRFTVRLPPSSQRTTVG